MSDVIEYFKNLEIDDNLDSIIISRIHKEIEKNYTEIAFQSGPKLEKLIKNSTYKQLKNVIKSMRFNIIKTKLGSRIWESIFIKLREFNKKIIFNWEDYFFDRNATYAIREYMKLNINLREKTDIIMGRIYKYQNIKEIMITFGIFLEILDDQNLILEVFKNFLKDPVEILSNPYNSHFFEKILEISDDKNLNNFYEIIKPYFNVLCTDKCGNYVIQKLILKYPVIIDNIKLDKLNDNILFQVILGTNDYKKMKFLIKKNYGDIFNMIIRENSIDSKYYKIAIKLFTIPIEYSMNINKNFKKKFENKWMYCRYGAELVLGYLKGHDDIKSKQKFIRNCRCEFKNMPLKKCSTKILVQMSRVADLKIRDEILNILRKYKNKK